VLDAQKVVLLWNAKVRRVWDKLNRDPSSQAGAVGRKQSKTTKRVVCESLFCSLVVNRFCTVISLLAQTKSRHVAPSNVCWFASQTAEMGNTFSLRSNDEETEVIPFDADIHDIETGVQNGVMDIEVC